MMQVNSLSGIGRFFNLSAFTMSGVSEIGVKKFINRNRNFVEQYGISSFGNIIRFIKSLEKLTNEGVLTADSIFFDNAALDVENHKESEIKARQKIEGEIKNFTNRGSFLSENSFISLFFESFINRGTVDTLSGTFFTGNTLRNYRELTLQNPKIDRLFNGESITESADANKHEKRAKSIFAMPFEEGKKAVAQLLEEIKGSNLLQKESERLSVHFGMTPKPQYSQKTFPLHRSESHKSILNVSVEKLDRKNLKEQYLQDIINSVVTLPKTSPSRANLEKRLRLLMSLGFNPVQLWLAKDILPGLQAAIQEAEKEELEKYYTGNPLADLKCLISVSGKSSIAKTQANLYIYSGSAIQELENTGQVEFVSRIHPIGRYIGTDASVLLVPNDE